MTPSKDSTRQPPVSALTLGALADLAEIVRMGLGTDGLLQVSESGRPYRTWSFPVIQLIGTGPGVADLGTVDSRVKAVPPASSRAGEGLGCCHMQTTPVGQDSSADTRKSVTPRASVG